MKRIFFNMRLVYCDILVSFFMFSKMMTSQKLKTLTIRHYDFNKLRGMPASVPYFLRD